MRLEDEDDMIDPELAEELIEYAIDNGINYFDTAYGYGDASGSSEKTIGNVIDKLNCRDKINISTKMYRDSINSREDMERMFAEELNNFKTDYIDYYYIHNVISYQHILELKEYGLFDFIEDKKQKRQIINIGFSFHGSYEDFKKVINEYDWDMTLLQYNYLDRDVQAGIKGIKLASERGMGVFIMEPLKGGALAGNMPPNAQKIIDDSEIKRSNADLALNWLYSNPEITCVLSGMTELDIVKENINITNNYINNPLTDIDLKVIDNVRDVLLDLTKIGCTNCEYCMPCPQEVEIPLIFELYNNTYLFPDKKIYGIHNSQILYSIDLIGNGHDGSKCVECGLCTTKCPQQLPIFELLKQVDEEFHGKDFRQLTPFIDKLLEDEEFTEKLELLYD